MAKIADPAGQGHVGLEAESRCVRYCCDVQADSTSPLHGACPCFQVRAFCISECIDRPISRVRTSTQYEQEAGNTWTLESSLLYGRDGSSTKYYRDGGA